MSSIRLCVIPCYAPGSVLKGVRSPPVYRVYEYMVWREHLVMLLWRISDIILSPRGRWSVRRKSLLC